jgi:adenylate cyclase
VQRHGTHATAIAAIEAARNEEQVIAEGCLAGERRASLARLAMIAMFAFSVEIVPRLEGREVPTDTIRAVIGSFYTLFALATAIQLRRVTPDPRRARIRPALLTVLDFSFISFQAAADIRAGIGMNPEMFAVAGSILIAFATVRPTCQSVGLAVGSAVAAFVALSIADGSITAETMCFVSGGFVALGFMVAMTNLAIREMFTALRRRDNLTRFLPMQVAERVLRIGPEALAPVQREVTVLFSDIRGFTTISESLPPQRVLEILDEYFGRMGQIVKGHDGVVGKFLGDGMLAFWNVPDRDPDHAAKAVRAALDMRRALIELNRERAEDGWPELRVGIGIHTGAVAAGMLGGPQQSEYTVIGDAVNVASRVEGLTKTLGAELLLTETTWTLCESRFVGRRLASEEIRGRREPVVLFTIDER